MTKTNAMLIHLILMAVLSLACGFGEAMEPAISNPQAVMLDNASADEAPSIDAAESLEQPEIESIEIMVLQTNPARVNAVVRGLSYAEDCTEQLRLEQRRNGSQFILNIQAEPKPELNCTASEPFERTVPLDMTDLPSGLYRVIAAGIMAEFELDLTPELEPSPDLSFGIESVAEVDGSGLAERFNAAVNGVTIEQSTTFPTEVTAIVQGAFTASCYQIDNYEQAYDAPNRRFIITLQAVGPLAEICTTAMVPFNVSIPLAAERLKAGAYTVSVNGVEAEFTLLVDNLIPDTPLIPGSEAPHQAWHTADFPEAGISVKVPPDWVQVGSSWSSKDTPALVMGLDWMTTSPNWQPTAMLPDGAQITGRSAIDLGWAEGLRYEVRFENNETVERHVVAPLDGVLAYNFYVRAESIETIKTNVLIHDFFSQSAILSQPQPFINATRFATANKPYQFFYPANFRATEPTPSITLVEGTDASQTVQATLQISSQPWDGMGYEQLIQERLRGLPETFVVKRADFKIDGADGAEAIEAVAIEGLPEGVPSRWVYIIHENKLHSLRFAPIDEDLPETQTHLEQLWQMVMSSFTFSDNLGDISPQSTAEPALPTEIVEPPLGTSGVLTALTVDACQAIQLDLKNQFGLLFNLDQAPIYDRLTNYEGTACSLSIDTGGASLASYQEHIDVAAAIIDILAKQGWQEDSAYAIVESGQVSTALKQANRFALLDIAWLPLPDAGCTSDLSTCQATPEQRIYAIQLRLAERE